MLCHSSHSRVSKTKAAHQSSSHPALPQFTFSRQQDSRRRRSRTCRRFATVHILASARPPRHRQRGGAGFATVHILASARHSKPIRLATRRFATVHILASARPGIALLSGDEALPQFTFSRQQDRRRQHPPRPVALPQFTFSRQQDNRQSKGGPENALPQFTFSRQQDDCGGRGVI